MNSTVLAAALISAAMCIPIAARAGVEGELLLSAESTQAQENGLWVIVATIIEPGNEPQANFYKADGAILKFASQAACEDFLKSGDPDFTDATDNLAEVVGEDGKVVVSCTSAPSR